MTELPILCFSYIRFSSARQELGDSLRRQLAYAEAYAREHGLHLDSRTYRDLGISAYDRSNIERGALAAFITAVNQGRIPRGSVLLIERFDRLSRTEPTHAVHLLTDLLTKGIDVVTLHNKRRYTVGSDGVELMQAVMEMQVAYYESDAKSERLTDVWTAKKALAATKIVTSEAPRWLKPRADRSGFDIDEERAESVRRVYAMRISGCGVTSITRRANAEKWAVPGNGSSWHSSLVGRILRNRAAVGEYQPRKYETIEDPATGRRSTTYIDDGAPVLGYYPRVISDEDFLRAQAVRIRQQDFPRRRDPSYANFMQGLIYCSCCGCSLVRKDKSSAKQPGYALYYCSRRHRGASDCPSARAHDIESAVILAVVTAAPAQLALTERAEELRTQLVTLGVERAAALVRIERLVEAVTAVANRSPALARAVLDAESQCSDIDARISHAHAELAQLEAEDPGALFDRLSRASTASSLEERAELRETLARIVSRIDVDLRSRILHVTLLHTNERLTMPYVADALFRQTSADFESLRRAYDPDFLS